MRTLVLTILILNSFLPAFAQLETSQWFLHNNRISVTPSGINNLTQSGITSSFNPTSASTSISDASGNLLFACDGRSIIDRNLLVMPALANNYLTSNNNKILAAKVPNSSKYYVFYSSVNSGLPNSAWTIKYALIDLSLNGGAGDVLSYNTIIASEVSQGFTLVQGEGTEDTWLLMQTSGTKTFLSYKITSSGLSNTPVISTAGSHWNSQEYIYKELKTSPNGQLVAGMVYIDYTNIFASTYRFVEVFNFDASSGILTNKIRSKKVYGYYDNFQSLEFSADNRLLYAGYMNRAYGLQPCGYGDGYIIQYNLCYTDTTDFSNFSMIVAQRFDWCQPNLSWKRIQMGADKRIYMPYTGTTISSLNNPNRIGNFCNYVFNTFQTTNLTNPEVVTPSFHHRLLEKAIKNNIVYDGGCFPNPIDFRITNEKVTNISWSFGDVASSANTSNAISPQHVFSAPGVYTVTAQLYDSDGKLIETLSELIEIKDPSKRVLEGYPKDTIFCSGGALKIKLNVVNGIFAWYRSDENGKRWISTADSIDIRSTGTYYVEMRQNDCNGCIQTDSVKVIVLPSPYISLGLDRKLCNGDSLQLYVNDRSASYKWSTGDTTTSVWINEGGTYWVQGEFNKNGCPQRDTIIINKVPGVSFAFPNDTTLCSNQTLMLNPGIPNASYSWQNGSTQSNFLVSKPGIYWTKIINNNGCIKADTINVSYIDAQQVNLGNDTTLCVGETLQLSAIIANANYLWSTGETTSGIKVSNSGSYWIKVNNGSCTVTDTINVRFQAKPEIALGRDTILCEKEKLTLSASNTGATYLWQDGSTQSFYNVDQEGFYKVKVTLNGCTNSDSVSVIYKPLPVLNLGNNFNICVGSNTLLNAYHSSIKSYNWQDGSSQPTFLVNNPGTYSVKVIGNNGCINQDFITVSLTSLPSFSLGKDTTLCEKQQLQLNIPLENATYLWNTGMTSNTQIIKQPGTYWLEVEQNSCSKRDSIVVNYKPLPSVFIGNDTTLCEGITKTLDAGNPGSTFKWQDMSTLSTFQVNKAGVYSVSVNFDGCIQRDTIQVSYKYKPVFTLGRDTVLCTGQELTLTPNVSNATLLWQDGSSSQSLKVNDIGTFKVTARNECGSFTDEISITKGICALYLPTAFTPNNDGLNDKFRVKDPGFIKTLQLTIYNRWGQLIFNTDDPYKGWDGKFNGIEQPEGNYVWQIKITTKQGAEAYKMGNVLLIR